MVSFASSIHFVAHKQRSIKINIRKERISNIHEVGEPGLEEIKIPILNPICKLSGNL